MTDLRACRVLVTATSFGQDDPGLKSTLASAVGEVVYNPTGRPLKAAELREMIRDIDGLIAGLDEIAGLGMFAVEPNAVAAKEFSYEPDGKPFCEIVLEFLR